MEDRRRILDFTGFQKHYNLKDTMIVRGVLEIERQERKSYPSASAMTFLLYMTYFGHVCTWGVHWVLLTVSRKMYKYDCRSANPFLYCYIEAKLS